MTTSRLPILRLDTPCQMPWDEMEFVDGQGTVRYCPQCALNVTDLSSMSSEEAEAFLARQADGRTCVSFMRDSNAAVVTLDYQQRQTSGWKWPMVATAAAVAMIAGGAAAYNVANPTRFGRVAGGLRPMPLATFSPFNANLPANAVCSTQTLATQLRTDAAIKPLASALPSGVEIIDLHYGVYPSALSAGYGRCIVVGEANLPALSSASAAAPTIRAVVWLMQAGYVNGADLSQRGESHPLRFAGTNSTGDVLIWSEDAELERSILAGLLSPTVTPPQPATGSTASTDE